jgi:hypothetical protein
MISWEIRWNKYSQQIDNALNQQAVSMSNFWGRNQGSRNQGMKVRVDFLTITNLMCYSQNFCFETHYSDSAALEGFSPKEGNTTMASLNWKLRLALTI